MSHCSSRVLVLAGLLFTLSLLGLATAPAAACCPSVNGSGICGDGTCSTPCCGYGGCNIFCCNCDGGCRTGCVTCSNSAAKTSDRERFNAVDTDHDDKISKAELAAWAKKANKHLNAAGVQRELAKIDADKSGFIEPGEFDKSLAPGGKAPK